jgi:hypothetical protein
MAFVIHHQHSVMQVVYLFFLFNGDVWFDSYDTSMKNLRIELLTLYLNELKNDRLA